jgi:zinc transport system substrate-binding protein
MSTLHALVALLGLAACSGEPAAAPAPAAHPLDVRALSFPAAWLVQRVAGDAVTLTNVNPPGEDPPAWQPSGDLVADLGNADLIVANGAGYEAWVTTVSLPPSKLLKLADGQDLITLPGVTHSHGKDGSHSHAGVDPHTWADPALFAKQAAALHDQLVALDPGHKATFDDGLARVQADLAALDQELAAALVGAKGHRLASSHPAFNYLARRYGLDVTSFEFDPSEAPEAAAKATFDAWTATAGAGPVLLWEAAPADAARAAFSADVRQTVLDPLEQPSADGSYDYLAKSRTNVAVFTGLFPSNGASPGPATP